METVITGRVHIFGDSVDTDMITPGKYLAVLDPEVLAEHVLEGADPGFPARVRSGDVIVAGENFGCGSSREHAPIAIRAAGISVVVACSFARIFYRNAINVGLPVLECPGVTGMVSGGDTIRVDLERGDVTNVRTGETLPGIPLSGKPLEIVRAGGLVEYVRASLEQQNSIV